ncbi:MAG: Gfo/Idh/MocA family oxidoreductase [Armatimonadota bacterium]
MKKVNIGMVGTGFAATFHTEAARRAYGAQADIVAVTSGHVENARRFSRQHAVADVYDTYDEMLQDDRIDVVDLCVPTNLHLPMTQKAAEAGKHVIVEKPLTGYTAEAGHDEDELIGNTVARQDMLDYLIERMDAVEALLESSGVRFMYAENWVYAPSVAKARRMIDSGGGTIMRIQAEESHSGSHASYASHWALAGGGSLLRTGSHPVGGVLHMKQHEGLQKHGTPIRPESVVGDVANLTKMESFLQENEKYLKHGLVDCEDWGAVLITFEDGSVAEVVSTDVVLGGIYNRMQLFCSNGRVECNMNPNNQVVGYAPGDDSFGDEYLAEKISTRQGWVYASPDEHWQSGYYAEMQDFVEAISQDREPLSGWTLARDVVAVIYAAYVSAEEGRRVRVP